MVAVTAGRLLGYRGMNLPQRTFAKKIAGKGDFDKLQILKMIKETLSSSVI